MPSIIYCDRAPFAVKDSVGEAERKISEAEAQGAYSILYFDKLFDSFGDNPQVALRISKISSIVPCNDRGQQGV